MTRSIARTTTALLFAATLVGGCDDGASGSSSSQVDDGGGQDDDDGGDDGSSDGDVFIRSFDVGDFTYSETIVYEWSDCTTTRTIEGVGNGECSSGSIGVGIPQSDGSKVAGGIGLCGQLTITDETTPASCNFDDSVTMEKTAVANLTLTAPTVDDPMKLVSKHDCPEFTLSTMVFAASALKEVGTAETFVLDASIDADCDDGTLHREVHVEVDVVVDK